MSVMLTNVEWGAVLGFWGSRHWPGPRLRNHGPRFRFPGLGCRGLDRSSRLGDSLVDPDSRAVWTSLVRDSDRLRLGRRPGRLTAKELVGPRVESPCGLRSRTRTRLVGTRVAGPALWTDGPSAAGSDSWRQGRGSWLNPARGLRPADRGFAGSGLRRSKPEARWSGSEPDSENGCPGNPRPGPRSRTPKSQSSEPADIFETI